MRSHGKTKLGFFPLPLAESERLRNYLAFLDEFPRSIPAWAMGALLPICLKVARHAATA